MVFVIQRSKEKTPMTVVPFNPPVCLPTGELDEKRAIERVRALWERTKVGTGDQERLQTELQEGLQEGDHQLAIWAVRMADESEICDTALRNVAIKLNALLLQRRDLPPLAPAHLTIFTYAQNALRHKRPPGRPWTDLLLRDIYICLLISEVCREFSVYPTRNRTERRVDAKRRRTSRTFAGADRAPSGCSIVTAVVGGCYNITEAHVQENIWGSPMAKRWRARGIIGDPLNIPQALSCEL
jgi:hypothetical protein